MAGGGGLGGAIFFLKLETFGCWIGGAGGGFVGLPWIISAMENVDYFAIDQRRKIGIRVPRVYALRQWCLAGIYTVCLLRAYVGSNLRANQCSPFVFAAFQDQHAGVFVQLGNFFSILRSWPLKPVKLYNSFVCSSFVRYVWYGFHAGAGDDS